MKINSPILFLEINDSNFVFLAFENKEGDNLNLIYENVIPIEGLKEKRIVDLKIFCNLIKENIYLIEQKLNFTFKEIILIIDNFDCSILTFSGYKKLNGSQLSKEDVTFIINFLKIQINETEKNKKILHIFNSKNLLDNKSTINLPIGLFGNFYSQELSFFLININDYKNLKNIFEKCHLKIKKIISKNFIDGAFLIDNNLKLETFFKIQLYKDYSQLIFFENSSLRFTQKFNFGTDIIIKDISKIVALNYDKVKNILSNSSFTEKKEENEMIEEKFFDGENFRKIKKKLLIDIAFARITEISDLIFFKNINIKSLLKKEIPIFLEILDRSIYKSFQSSLRSSFSKNNLFKLSFLDTYTQEQYYNNAYKIVQYGWKKEAVPIIQEKKSLIARFFDLIFK